MRALAAIEQLPGSSKIKSLFTTIRSRPGLRVRRVLCACFFFFLKGYALHTATVSLSRCKFYAKLTNSAPRHQMYDEPETGRGEKRSPLESSPLPWSTPRNSGLIFFPYCFETYYTVFLNLNYFVISCAYSELASNLFDIPVHDIEERARCACNVE